MTSITITHDQLAELYDAAGKLIEAYERTARKLERCIMLIRYMKDHVPEYVRETVEEELKKVMER